MQDDADLVGALAGVVGRQHLVAADEDQEPYLVDWRGRYRGRAAAVVKPASTEQVAAVVRLCAERGVRVVPQGGNTGMCGAATPPSAPSDLGGAQRAGSVAAGPPRSTRLTALPPRCPPDPLEPVALAHRHAERRVDAPRVAVRDQDVPAC